MCIKPDRAFSYVDVSHSRIERKVHHFGVQGDSSFYGGDLNKWRKDNWLILTNGEKITGNLNK